MVIALIMSLPGVTQEQYETVRGMLGAEPPAGNLVHAAGPTDDGWRIVEVWESPAAAEAFFGSDLAHRAFEAAQMPPVQPASFPIHTLASTGSIIS